MDGLVFWIYFFQTFGHPDRIRLLRSTWPPRQSGGADAAGGRIAATLQPLGGRNELSERLLSGAQNTKVASFAKR